VWKEADDLQIGRLNYKGRPFNGDSDAQRHSRKKKLPAALVGSRCGPARQPNAQREAHTQKL